MGPQLLIWTHTTEERHGSNNARSTDIQVVFKKLSLPVTQKIA